MKEDKKQGCIMFLISGWGPLANSRIGLQKLILQGLFYILLQFKKAEFSEENMNVSAYP